jgi:outer membrane protein assembly factor BamA
VKPLKLLFSILFISSLLWSFDAGAPDTSISTGGLAFYPVLYYTPETRWAAGAGGLYFYRPDPTVERPTTIALSSAYTQNQQTFIEITSNVFFDNDRYWHTGSFYYQKFPNSFYGIGNRTPETAEEKFTAEIIRINPALLFRIAPKLYIGPQVHYESWRLLATEATGSLTRQTIAGSGPTTVAGVGLTINIDERDNIFAPQRGRFYQAVFLASPSFLGSTFDFTRTRFDLREYFPLGNAHIVSAQVLFHTTTGTVPFRFLPQIGGQNILRGHFEGRYTDKNMAAVQTEYRSPFMHRFGFAVFGGFGDVANRFTSFSSGNLKYSYGIGLRFAFIPEEFIILRIDYGRGNNSDGVYVTLNEAI